MTTPTLADLRRAYYGGGSDAEYAALLAASQAGVTALSSMDNAQKKGGWDKIAEQTLAAPAAAIDIAGIDQSYKTLKVFASLRGDTNAAFVEALVNINNDLVDANYFQERFQGSAAAASAVENLGAAASRRCGLLPALTAPAEVFGQMELTVVDYALANKIKVADVKCNALWSLGAGGMIVRHVSFIRNNHDAIQRLSIAALAGNFVAGSSVSIYGAKSAFG